MLEEELKKLKERNDEMLATRQDTDEQQHAPQHAPRISEMRIGEELENLRENMPQIMQILASKGFRPEDIGITGEWLEGCPCCGIIDDNEPPKPTKAWKKCRSDITLKGIFQIPQAVKAEISIAETYAIVTNIDEIIDMIPDHAVKEPTYVGRYQCERVDDQDDYAIHDWIFDICVYPPS